MFKWSLKFQTWCTFFCYAIFCRIVFLGNFRQNLLDIKVGAIDKNIFERIKHIYSAIRDWLMQFGEQEVRCSDFHRPDVGNMSLKYLKRSILALCEFYNFFYFFLKKVFCKAYPNFWSSVDSRSKIAKPGRGFWGQIPPFPKMFQLAKGCFRLFRLP